MKLELEDELGAGWLAGWLALRLDLDLDSVTQTAPGIREQRNAQAQAPTQKEDDR